MRDFRQFDVWQKARTLVTAVYRESARFPVEEQYGFTTQLRRAVVSVPANIAEGAGRRSDRDFARFLDVAMGSLSETRSHLILACDLGYLKDRTVADLSEEALEIGRMLDGLNITLRRTGRASGLKSRRAS